jgi:hypothetical protein
MIRNHVADLNQRLVYAVPIETLESPRCRIAASHIRRRLELVRSQEARPGQRDD